jgi:hypothetical protein
MMARPILSGAAVMLLIALTACGERPQTMDVAAKRSDAAPWAHSDAANPAFAAPGWKGGDRAAWDAQIRARTQGQNDYAPR